MRTYPLMRGLMVALVLALAAPTVAPAQVVVKDNAKFLKLFEPVVEAPGKATVDVLCNGKNVALGTIVKSDGLIITLASELNGTAKVRLADGREFEAQLVGLEKRYNLALLKVDAGDLPTVNWRPSKQVNVGSWAVSVGTGKDPVAVGVVSVPMRKMKYNGNAGDSPNQGFMGVNLSTSSKEVRVEEVLPSTGAAKAGMKAGDIIVGVDGKEVTDGGSLKKIMQGYKQGKNVEVKVQRGDEVRILKVTLGPRPPSRSDVQNQMGSKLSNVRTGFPVILQHDSIIKPEVCGGPLVDLDGKAIGINVCRAGRTESYAIPTEAVLPLIDEMVAGKHPPKGTDKTGAGVSSK